MHITQSLSRKTLEIVRNRPHPLVEIVGCLADGFQRCLSLCNNPILVVARQELVGLRQNGVNTHRSSVQASHHILGVSDDLVDVSGVLTKFLNNVGVLCQCVGESLRVVDCIRQRSTSILYETLQLTKHGIGSCSNILCGSKKIVD
ncbi:hypothetical protein D3C80_1357550 [compost metagenome]